VQLSTGSDGYFGQSGSVSPRSHMEKVEPRPERTTRWWRQEPQSPVGGETIASGGSQADPAGLLPDAVGVSLGR